MNSIITNKRYDALTNDEKNQILSYGKTIDGSNAPLKKTGDINLYKIKHCSLCNCNLSNITYHILTDRHLKNMGLEVPTRISMRGKIKNKTKNKCLNELMN